jgi:hypothetical protein
MNRLVATFAVSCFLLSGCEAPEPPQPEAPPPELTPEIARTALVEMMRVNADTVPHYPINELVRAQIEVHPTGYASAHAFSIHTAQKTWAVNSNGPGCIWLINGDFAFSDGRWVARITSKALANTGPGFPNEPARRE